MGEDRRDETARMFPRTGHYAPLRCAWTPSLRSTLRSTMRSTLRDGVSQRWQGHCPASRCTHASLRLA
jgi:hypothetical protein